MKYQSQSSLISSLTAYVVCQTIFKTFFINLVQFAFTPIAFVSNARHLDLILKCLEVLELLFEKMDRKYLTCHNLARLKNSCVLVANIFQVDTASIIYPHFIHLSVSPYERAFFKNLDLTVTPVQPPCTIDLKLFVPILV